MDEQLREMLEMRSALYAILDSHNVAEYYYNNCEKDVFKLHPIMWIVRAFTWATTPQGWREWNNIYEEWKFFLQQQKKI